MGIEKLTTLAFSLYTNKGAYALLLGSGISREAGIPSGWEVEEELIRKIGASKGVENEKDWHKWYQDKYGRSASYSSLLEEIVKTPTERVELMKSFFEPTDEDRELGRKYPTKAHISIAKLAKEGYIRVILTTNFDRLLEDAFKSEGITPQVISSEEGISQATTIIHSKAPTIIKVNGDYIDCKFRNTSKELDEYPEQMNLYLNRIFEDFGLITCGWSGEWDKGLVKIIKEAKLSRYNSFFTDLVEVKGNLKSLSQSRLGEAMSIKGADDLFNELYEQVMALKECDANANMSHDIMIARIKKYLSSKQYDIAFADMIEKWGTDAYNRIMDFAHYNFELDREAFNRYLEIHLEAIKPLLEAAILTARWGKKKQIKLFGDILIKLCLDPKREIEKPQKEEQHETQYLHLLAPMLLLNTIGVACVKYGRFKELDYILKLIVPPFHLMGFIDIPLLHLLGTNHWDNETWSKLMGFSIYSPFSRFFLDNLAPIFKDYFLYEFQDMFCIWEHLKSLVYGYNQFYLKFWGFYIPVGAFLHLRAEQEMKLYTLFFEEAEILKNDWKPIKQGMFGGSHDNYKKISKLAEDYYSKTPIWE